MGERGSHRTKKGGHRIHYLFIHRINGRIMGFEGSLYSTQVSLRFICGFLETAPKKAMGPKE